ncbi:hypothetical protein EG329_006274 [Mollisiaceae sp. DMI_Dod_QoI]|nr:hypothetical protein EG329_006274 [Helotiales sp. DMI_Dod_QoI]
MAFESNTLVNGEWTTRVLDLNTVLRHYDQQDKENAANQMDVEKTPKFGLLTQTIIRSPLVHWILPVKLRDSRIQDVAFIGDDFVQIKELRSDGLLWEVVQKEDFGARIRNAAVIGSISAYEKDPDTRFETTQVKSEEEDVGMDQDEPTHRSASSGRRSLPPQFLVLQLETGDLIFLMLQATGLGQPQFITSRFGVSKSMLRLQPGTHIAVDPSSRYMAIACSEGMFAVYELHTRANLQEQFSKGRKLNFIASGAQIQVHDVIMKMEFLYPTLGDDGHIILLALIIRKGKTRMLIYEWDLNHDVKNISAKSVKGHQLDKSRQMPLLLIPLMIKSAFILVYEDSMSVCEGMVSNFPTFTDFNSRVDSPTAFHNGSTAPLWTSWARPARRPDFLAHQDNIFIAREDGLIKFLHINEALDVEDNNIGQFSANCGTAFASLDFKKRSSSFKDGDLLVIGGDSCPGGTYLLEARGLPVLTEPVQNWTPALDFVTTYVTKIEDAHSNRVNTTGEVVPNPDRIFACVGKGLKGAIAEFRYGLEARIGVETEYDAPILQVWALSSEFDAIEDYDASLFLLSMGDTSTVLSLSGDAADMAELDESSTKFDLSNRTITVATQETSMIQVTERTITVIGRGFDRKYHVSELPGMAGTSIDNATVSDAIILFTTYVGDSVHLQVLEHSLLASNMDLDEHARVRLLNTISSNVTSLRIEEIAQTSFAIMADWSESSINLTFQTIEGGDRHLIDLLTTLNDFDARIDAVVSLALILSVGDDFLLLCGTRNGLLITLDVSAKTFKVNKRRVDWIGATSVVLTRDDHPEHEHTFFISCDSKLYHLKPVLSRRAGESRTFWWGQAHAIHQIWLSDVLNPCLQQPSIASFAQLRHAISPTSRLNQSLLLVSGSTLFLADLSILPKAVPRYIPIGGTPTRLLYSYSLGAIVVAMSIGKLSTLKFVDPDTGEDLSQPIDQETKAPVDFVSGLGNLDEKVFRLFEWAYTKDYKTWNFLIAATSLGRLLIISTDHSSPRTNGNVLGHSRPRISYYTRHKFKSSEPVYSVTGFPEGLLWCAGTKLFCDVLDQAQKKFVRVAEYDLPSPAINLEYVNRSIFALTQCHSLEVLKLVLNENGDSIIVRTHGDQLTRNALHHIVLQLSPQNPLHLVSDKECSLVGLWPITNTRADTLETVFEAELPNSILRFRSAKCRPIWDSSWVAGTEKLTTTGLKSTPCSPGSSNQPETLGLSITGSLSHFTVLQLTTWKYLKFLVDLAIRSPKVCEFTHKDGPVPLDSITEPKLRMQIDGDILKRCLLGRQLEDLLRIGENTPEANKIFERFCELLRDHHGEYVSNAEPEMYLEQAYADLSYFLRPVL